MRPCRRARCEIGRYLFDVLAGLGAAFDEVRALDLAEELHGFVFWDLPAVLEIELGADEKQEGLLVGVLFYLAYPAAQRMEAVNPMCHSNNVTYQ